MHKKSEAGNVIFLILIAIILFAALAMAITNSSNSSGGNSNSEDGKLGASVVEQEVVRLEAEMKRMSFNKNYEQVLYNDSAYSTTGVCYRAGVTRTCPSIGLFNPGQGIMPPYLPAKYLTTQSGVRSTMEHRRLIVGGVEVGTSAADVWITLRPLTRWVCEGYNLKRNLSGTIPLQTYGPESGPDGRSELQYIAQPPSFSATHSAAAADALKIDDIACVERPDGIYEVIHILERN